MSTPGHGPADDRARAAHLLAAGPTDRPLLLPVSAVQRGLWLREQRAGGRSTYRIGRTVLLDGPLMPSALAGAVSDLVDRHEALRTTFPVPDGEPMQRIAPPAGYELATVDVPDEPAAAEYVRCLATEPVDLARGPVFSAVLLRVNPSTHQLVLRLHHITVDGWGLEVLLRDLAALYGARLAGGRADLPPPGAYRDFVLAERRWLGTPGYRRELRQWVRRLDGTPPLDLGAAPGTARPAGAVRLHLDAGPVSAARPRLGGATASHVLLAAFAVLLHRYTGQADFAVGVPVANRERWPDTAGCFADILVARFDLSGNPRFAEVVRQASRAVLDGLRGHRPPVEDIVRELGTSGTALFDAAVSILDAGSAEYQLPGLRTAVVAVPPDGETSFALSLQLGVRSGGPITGELGYDAALLDTGTAGAIPGHLRRLVESGCATPDRRVGALSMLRAQERERLVRLGTGRPMPQGDPVSVAARFAAAAARWPDRTAVIDPVADRGLSYRDLDAWTTQLGGALHAAGIRRGDRVGVPAVRGLANVVATVAAARAGVSYVPLDPADPLPRLADIARQTGLVAVVVPSGGPPLPEPLAHLALLFDPPASRAAGAPRQAPPTGSDELYVMYTSGSTAAPKGVTVSHRAVLRLVDEEYLLPGQRWSATAPPGFDAATLELWAPLLTGGTVVLSPPGEPDLDALGDLLTEHRIDTCWLTTGLFHAMVAERPEALRRVRTVLAGGEQLSASHARTLLRHWSGVLVNGYGPTENTTFTTSHAMRADTPVPDLVPIGVPVPGSTVYLVDEHLNLVPRGIRGELVTGGDGVATGYLNRPGETAARFVPDPFGARPGGRLYRTGDLARWLPDGTLEFLGRADRQVKVRGHRIEPAAVEAVLREHPGVRDCVVEARGDLLVGYVAGEATPEELTAACAARLPAYQRPGVWIVLDALPLTPAGKPDRAALPAPPLPVGEPPRPGVEAEVAAIWAAVLACPVTDRAADFFALGGHSLAAAHIVAQVRRALAPDLAFRILFDQPELADFASAVAAAMPGQRPGERN